MSDLASIEVTADGDEHSTVVVAGEIDASNADRVFRQLQAALDTPSVTLDLSQLEFLDSAAVRVLFALAHSASLRGVGLSALVPPASPVRRVLGLSGVDAVLAIQPATDGSG